VPTFPNARHVISKKEFDACQGAADPSFSDQPLKDSVLPLPAAGRIVRADDAFGFEYDPIEW